MFLVCNVRGRGQIFVRSRLGNGRQMSRSRRKSRGGRSYQEPSRFGSCPGESSVAMCMMNHGSYVRTFAGQRNRRGSYDMPRRSRERRQEDSCWREYGEDRKIVGRSSRFTMKDRPRVHLRSTCEDKNSTNRCCHHHRNERDCYQSFSK